MSTIYAKPNTGVWYIQYVQAGRRIAKSLKTKSKRRALEKQREFDEQRQRESLGLPAEPSQTLRIAHCAEKYLKAAREAGTASKSALDRMSASLALFGVLYGAVDAGDVTPRLLKGFQSALKGKKLSRRTINDYVGEIRRFFKWMASEDMIAASVYLGLTTVETVKRTDPKLARREDVGPVDRKAVDAIREHVPSCVWAMIQLQLCTAARPGEVCALRPCDIDDTGKVWVARPSLHKTAHLEKTRAIYFGPEAQKILRPYLKRPSTSFLFSPIDALKERNAKAFSHRRPNQKPNKRVTARRMRDHWTVNAYRKCITAACDEAKIDRWTPNMLRHTAATEIRAKYGIEAAQVFLGHSTLDATQIYAEANETLARKIAGEWG